MVKLRARLSAAFAKIPTCFTTPTSSMGARVDLPSVAEGIYCRDGVASVCRRVLAGCFRNSWKNPALGPSEAHRIVVDDLSSCVAA